MKRSKLDVCIGTVGQDKNCISKEEIKVKVFADCDCNKQKPVTITVPTSFNNYWIKDIDLVNEGARVVEETSRKMVGLAQLKKDFSEQKPFRGVRITVCVTVTCETAVFALLLHELGGEVRICSDNLDGSNDAACALIASRGIHVFAKKGMTEEERYWSYEQAIRFHDEYGNTVSPALIVDDGGDITTYLHERHPEVYSNSEFIGTSEQTRCGAYRVRSLREQRKLRTPVIDVDDTKTKGLIDNASGSRESFVRGLLKAIKGRIAGKQVIIFGAGRVGWDLALVLKSFGAHVHIVEAKIFPASRALLNGFPVLSKEQALSKGDIFITCTGVINTIDALDFRGITKCSTLECIPIVANNGHQGEVNTRYLDNNLLLEKAQVTEFVDRYTFPNGGSIDLLCKGRLVNFYAAEGHSPETMDATFTLHVLALLELLIHKSKYSRADVYRLPEELDEKASLLCFPDLRTKLVKLTDEQIRYIGKSISHETSQITIMDILRQSKTIAKSRILAGTSSN